MGRWKTLIMNTFLLTAASLVMRCIAMAYQVWLAGQIGAAGIGLFQLVMSVNVLCVTFAISGIRFTATRLISEEMGAKSGGVSEAMRSCIAYALFFGLAAFSLLFLLAERIGFLWIGDARTVLSLKIISFSLPFVSLSSVINGYFIAVGKVYKTAISQVFEQLLNIALVAFLLPKASGNLEESCTAISLGCTFADVGGLILLIVMYLAGREKRVNSSGNGIFGRMIRIAFPLALSAYARTSLTTLQNLLVPKCLKKSGLSADDALAGYGVINGMVYPIISFPSCILSAVAELIIPDLTKAQVRGDKKYIKRTVSRIYKATLIFALTVAAFIFISADALGMMIYKSNDLGPYLRIFALILPIMYMDIVTDGCLKGLGEMMYSMKINITEALIGVLLVISVLPRHALNGYIAIIFICEIFNFIFSLLRLRKYTSTKLL
ncbi:MAG: oligosaccharide flippase family protein [Oscillospiraceae bacterium]|nr:oligosaccharide flippase family protein [Oscillospiraceae bacterium]